MFGKFPGNYMGAPTCYGMGPMRPIPCMICVGKDDVFVLCMSSQKARPSWKGGERTYSFALSPSRCFCLRRRASFPGY